MQESNKLQSGNFFLLVSSTCTWQVLNPQSQPPSNSYKERRYHLS